MLKNTRQNQLQISGESVPVTHSAFRVIHKNGNHGQHSTSYFTFLSLPVCVHTCVCAGTCGCAVTHVQVCLEVTDGCWGSSPITITSLLKTALFLKLQLTDMVRSAHQQAPKILRLHFSNAEFIDT